MTNCTEPNRAACPRLCSDFCNAKEEDNARRSVAACSRCAEWKQLAERLGEALEAADECLALIEDAGHAAHTYNVTVARGIVTKARNQHTTNTSNSQSNK